MHRAVGSQFIYNRQSRQSLFLGALTSDKWLTVLRLQVNEKHINEKKAGITSYEVDSTGTTELAKENSLKESPEEDQIELSLPVGAGPKSHIRTYRSQLFLRLPCATGIVRRNHPQLARGKSERPNAYRLVELDCILLRPHRGTGAY